MNKKIMAIALAMVFIATAFTACKKEIETMKISGGEYPVYRDDKGELVINDGNEIAILVTDRQNQEVITEEGGEPQTYWLPMNVDTIGDGFIQGKNYKLNIPDGWTGSKYGRVVKNNTDDKCYIKFTKHTDLKKDETIETYLDALDSESEAIGEKINDSVAMAELIKKNPSFAAYEECKYTLEKKETVLPGSINSHVRIHKIEDKDGKVVHYAENYFFVAKGEVYAVEYACVDGIGYDESFRFADYLRNNFTFKEPKK